MIGHNPNHHNKTYSVLIIEDELKVAEILRSYLKLYSKFNHVIIAKDGVQAWQKLTNQDFDLIITDIMMPGNNGIQFIGKMRKIPRYFSQKIIVVSGCLTQENSHKCIRYGIRHLIVKPFTARQVLTSAILSLSSEEDPKEVVDAIIHKLANHLLANKEKLTSVIPDQEVVELLKHVKNKG